MDFFIDDQELERMADLEDKLNCNISAGLEWGAHLCDLLRDQESYVDSQKLVALLSESLSSIMSLGEIQDLANDVQSQVKDRVNQLSNSFEESQKTA